MKGLQQRKITKQKRSCSNSETFKEGSLFKQAGQFTYQLDNAAPNLYNNKVLLRNSINLIKFPKSSTTKHQYVQRINEMLADRSLITNSGFKNGSPNPEERQKSIDSINNKFNLVDQGESQKLRGVTKALVSDESQTKLKTSVSPVKKIEHFDIVTGQHHMHDMIKEIGMRTGRAISLDYNSSKQSNRYAISSANKSIYTLSNMTGNTSKYKNYNFKKTFEGVDCKTQLQNFQRISEFRQTSSNFGDHNKSFGSYPSCIQQPLSNEKTKLIQYTLDSREQYQKNRAIKPSLLVAPIDTIDLRTSKKQEFETLIARGAQTSLNNYRISNNDQSFKHQEPTERKTKKISYKLDFINSSMHIRTESVQNGKVRNISDFHEQEQKPHHLADYKNKVERFPALFSKKKTEFGKINNALPTTSLIIKSSFIQKKH